MASINRTVGLIVGLPLAGRPVVPEWALSLASQNYGMNTNVSMVAVKGAEVDVARNGIAEEALKLNAKYIWFLDDDVAPPTFAARKLMTDLEQADNDVMIAAGIYCAKQEPTEPVVFQDAGMGPFWKWKEGDVFECKGIGTGCMMIRTEVFRHIQRPWFLTIDEDRPAESDVAKRMITDDLYFCQKVTDAGFKILADGGVLCTHWDVGTYQSYTLPEGSYPLRANVA